MSRKSFIERSECVDIEAAIHCLAFAFSCITITVFLSTAPIYAHYKLSK